MLDLEVEPEQVVQVGPLLPVENSGAPSAPTGHGQGRPYDGDNIPDNNSDDNSDNNGDTRKPAALAKPQLRPLFSCGEYSDFPLFSRSALLW
ncbi:hypothetical protein ACWGBO_34700 [[Kitasatospora] papulosa]